MPTDEEEKAIAAHYAAKEKRERERAERIKVVAAARLRGQYAIQGKGTPTHKEIYAAQLAALHADKVQRDIAASEADADRRGVPAHRRIR